MSQSIILPRRAPREAAIKRIGLILASLPIEAAWRVEFSPYNAKRSDSQNRLLWALYGDILERGGESMAGWTKDDLHEFFLIHHFGSETRELFGKKRLIPLKRSSKLPKMEFVDFVDSIVQFMAERGVVLDLPGDYE